MEGNPKSLPYPQSQQYPYSILSNASAPNYYNGPPKSANPNRSHTPSPSSLFQKQHPNQQQQRPSRYSYHHPGYPHTGYSSTPPYGTTYPYLSYMHQVNSPYYMPSTYFFTNSARLQELSNRLQSWKTISIGLSFLALILLTCKLYDVDREISYLQYISNEWLSPEAINRDLLHLSSPSLTSSTSAPLYSGSLLSSSNRLQGSSLHSSQQKSPSLSSPSVHSQHHNLYSGGNNRTSNMPVGTIIAHHPQHSHSSPRDHLRPVNVELVTSDFDKEATPVALALVSNSKPSKKPHEKLKSSASNSRSKAVDNEPHQQPQLNGAHHLPQMLDAKLQNTLFLIENFREDIDILVVELWSSRTTLVLSLVFVFVYIISWCWMAYAIRETTTPDISLKTVLLLAIFAAVDIAASAGFVMVRIIMYVMRDYYFPRDMRVPILTAEFNQMASYVALRLVTLKSGTGVVDIFVSVIVGFLTSLRVYSVVCAVSFYRRARKEILNVNNFEYMVEKGLPRQAAHYLPPTVFTTANQLKMSNGISKPNGGILANGDVKHEAPNGFIPKMRMLNAHKDLDRRFSIMAEEESSSSDEDPVTELKVQAVDMPPNMQKSAMQSTVHALRTYSTEKHIAESIKQNFDQMYEPTWHCIVGRNWGSCVTHTKSNYIRMLYKDLTILLYKSS